MGMSAEILAIGPFSKDVADILSYPANQYAGTRPGVSVVTHLFMYIDVNSACYDFAKCLGISDAWDFNQHKIDPAKVDLDALRRLLDTFVGGEDFVCDIDRFIRLRDNHFDFYFMPNG